MNLKMKPEQIKLPVKSQERRKSILVSPPNQANVGKRPEASGDREETEIVVQISVPRDGGWGWVVLSSSFCSIFVLDGMVFTFGSILHNISVEFNASHSIVALINSISLSLYFMLSPVASALINRFGFRTTIMTGSVICSLSLFSSYFSTSLAYLFVFYGFFNGFGCSLIQMSAGLVVGFYFEKLRSIAMAIATCGTSLGIVIMSPLNTYLVRVADWRTVVLLQSGMIGLAFFFGMSYKPLLSLTVTKFEDNTENPTKTVTFLPNLEAARRPSKKFERMSTRASERFFNAVSNHNYPTAAAVVDEDAVLVDEDIVFVDQGSEGSSEQAGPSTSTVSKLTLTANIPQGGISHRQLTQAQILMSKTSIQDKTKSNLEINLPIVKKVGCCGPCCQWESHIPQARPMYRDDAFYTGHHTNLPAYTKSQTNKTEEEKTGLEYQLAVSRAVSIKDLQEHHRICSTAVRRVFSTMIDPSLLKEGKFVLLCCSGFLAYAGVLVPFVFLRDRNEKAGVDSKHCVYFVSAIGLANAIGRFFFALLARKVNPLLIYGTACLLAGLSTILSNLSFNVMYQYSYCVTFGFCVSGLTSLRSILIVSLFGLEKLTNCTGMMLIFVGLGILISTPLGGFLKDLYGYKIAFDVSGTFIFLSGIVMILITRVVAKEKSERNVFVTGKENTKNVHINLSNTSKKNTFKEAKTLERKVVIQEE